MKKQAVVRNFFLAFSLITSTSSFSVPKLQVRALMTLGMMFSPSSGFGTFIKQATTARRLSAPWPAFQTQQVLWRHPAHVRPIGALSHLANQGQNHPQLAIDFPRHELKDEFMSLANTNAVNSRYWRGTLEEVRQLTEEDLDFTGLEDLTSLEFVTIDNDDSKDLDQALFIANNPDDGTYRVYYAIADASFFSVPGTSLDKEAAERVFTSYLPGFDVPIFPRLISEDLCSLAPLKKRRAVVIIMDFSADGAMLGKSFVHGAIASKAQLSYRKVQEYYDLGTDHPYAKMPYRNSLDNLQMLGGALVQKSKDRGVVDFAFNEVGIHPDDRAGIYTVSQNTRYLVEKYNEQISVASNRAVAEYFQEHSLQSMHRFHPATSEERLNIAKSKLENLDKPWGDEQNMQDYLASLDGSSLVEEIAKSIACRSNLKAKYSANHDHRGHDGLKLRSYDHFTAPMRRYTDIINHRILLAHLKGEQVPYQSNAKGLPQFLKRQYLERYAQKANRARFREEKIKRSIDDYVSSLLLLPIKDQQLKATVVYVTDKGMIVRIDNHPFDRWLESKNAPGSGVASAFVEGQSIDIELEETWFEGKRYLNPKIVEQGS